MPRSGLLSLSNDILLEILSLLTSVPALSAVSLVSKALRALTQPRLYKRIEWKLAPRYGQSSIEGIQDELLEGPLSIKLPLTRLLRTVLQRPEVASYVEAFSVQGTDERFYSWSKITTLSVALDDLEMNLAVQAIRSTGVAHTAEWLSGLHRGTADALLSLLIAQLSSLRSLSLKVPFTQESSLIGKLLAAALVDCTSSLPRYRHLTKVTFELLSDSRHWRFPGVNLANVMPLFYLERIQELEIGLDSPEELEWYTRVPSLSSLTRLDLHLVRERHLSTILAITPRLRSLRWVLRTFEPHSYQTPRSGSNSDTVDLDMIGEALLEVRDSLEHLTLSNSVEVDPRPWEAGSCMVLKGGLQSLRLLSRLETLSGPIEMLLASFNPEASLQLEAVVPPSIQILTITNEMQYHNFPDWDMDTERYQPNDWKPSDILDVLGRLTKHAGVIVPHLRTIRLLSVEMRVRGFQDGYSDDSLLSAEIESIAELCSAYGIAVEAANAGVIEW